jgi:hypothetical protein
VLLATAWEWTGLAGYRGAPRRLLYLVAVCALMALGW